MVLDSASPLPLISSVLDTLFNRFQTPSVSILSTATMATIGAGVRSSLVVDMGWNEMIITSVYEYREVKSTRTIRSGKFLLGQVSKFLEELVPSSKTEEETDKTEKRKSQQEEERKKKSKKVQNAHNVSFQECEDIIHRLMWCRPSTFGSSQRQSAQLETVEEQDETELESQATSQSPGIAHVPLQSLPEPKTIDIPFEKLADICDDTFFAPTAASTEFDDDDLPVHILIYQHLLGIPIDVRGICMPRIIFTGGCSNILGIKERIIDEMTNLIDKRGWEPVSGKRAEQLRSNGKIQRDSIKSQASDTSVANSEATDDSETTVKSTATSEPEADPVEAKVMRHRQVAPLLQGQVRVINSLGPWAGASLLCQLKIPAIATVDRDLWLQHGVYGASRASDVDVKTQRQGMSAAGMMRGSGGHHSNWTLGAWGA